MTPAQLDTIQDQLESQASTHRRPLPTQDAIRADLIQFGGQLEECVDMIADSVDDRYSKADLWAVAGLIAQEKVKELTNGI